MTLPRPDPAADQLLNFWFGQLEDGFADDVHRQRWFMGGDEFDSACRTQFGALQDQAHAGALDHWTSSPRGMLALILLCDQIPRNIFRNDARAFRTDPLALAAAHQGVVAGFDRQLGFDERAFCYLPFEHSENLLHQHTAVGLYTLLRDETPQGKRHLTGNYLQHAHQHRDTIIRFDRFPYRNAALGRTNSAAETQYLASQD